MKNLIFFLLLLLGISSCMKDDFYSEMIIETPNMDSLNKLERTRDSLWLMAILNHIDSGFNKLNVTVNVTVIKKDSIVINNNITNNITNNNINNNIVIDSSKTTNIYQTNGGHDTTIYVHTTSTVYHQPIAYSILQPKCNVGGTLKLSGLPDGV